MGEYFKSLSAGIKEDYCNKLLHLGVTVSDFDPFVKDDDRWIDDVTKWPDVEFGQIYCYLIDSHGNFTRETLKAYRSLEAYNYFHSGWVHTCYYANGPNGKCFVKAKVNRSQTLSEKPHEAWVCIEKCDGSICGAHCTCMAGLGEVCSHVAAILFKIEACVRLGFNKVACTSLPCQWNQNFTKKVEAVPLRDIKFTKPKKNNFHNTTRQSMVLGTKPTFAATTSFLEKLKSANPNAVIFTVTNPKPNPPIKTVTFPFKMSDYFKDEYVHLKSDEIHVMCDEIIDNMTATNAEIAALEEASRDQSNSWSWFEYRKGRLTASNFYDICHTSIEKPSVTLISRICQYDPVVETLAIKWGKQNETEALDNY